MSEMPRINWDFDEVLRQSYEDEVCNYGVSRAVLSSGRSVIFDEQLVRSGGPPMKQAVSVAGYVGRTWYGRKRAIPIPSDEREKIADELYQILIAQGRDIERANVFVE